MDRSPISRSALSSSESDPPITKKPTDETSTGDSTQQHVQEVQATPTSPNMDTQVSSLHSDDTPRIQRPDTHVGREIFLRKNGYKDFPHITASKWKELKVVPDWIKRNLILVAVKYYKRLPVVLLHTYGQVPQPEQEPCEEQDSRDVQELCRKQNPQGEYEFRTYLLGTCKSLGLTEENENNPREAVELRGARIRQAKFGGDPFLIILKEDAETGESRVCCRGLNNRYQLGLGHDRNVYHFTENPDIAKVVNIDVGQSHCLALCKTKKVYSWGYNENGRCGGDRKCVERPTIISNGRGDAIANIVKISCGPKSSALVTTDGQLLKLGGINIDNHASAEEQESVKKGIPARIRYPEKHTAKDVICGRKLMAVLCEDGAMFCWVNKDHGLDKTNMSPLSASTDANLNPGNKIIVENIIANFNGDVVLRTIDGQLLSLDGEPFPDPHHRSHWLILDPQIRHPQDAFADAHFSETYGAVVVDFPAWPVIKRNECRELQLLPCWFLLHADRVVRGSIHTLILADDHGVYLANNCTGHVMELEDLGENAVIDAKFTSDGGSLIILCDDGVLHYICGQQYDVISEEVYSFDTGICRVIFLIGNTLIKTAEIDDVKGQFEITHTIDCKRNKYIDVSISQGSISALTENGEVVVWDSNDQEFRTASEDVRFEKHCEIHMLDTKCRYNHWIKHVLDNHTLVETEVFTDSRDGTQSPDQFWLFLTGVINRGEVLTAKVVDDRWAFLFRYIGQGTLYHCLAEGPLFRYPSNELDIEKTRQTYRFIIRALMRAGIDIHAAAKSGQTALHSSLIWGNTIVASELLRCAEDGVREIMCTKYACGGNGLKAGHLAAKHGHVEILREMMNFGLDLGIEDTEGKCPLHFAIIHNQYEVFEFLLHDNKQWRSKGELMGYISRSIKADNWKAVKDIVKWAETRKMVTSLTNYVEPTTTKTLLHLAVERRQDDLLEAILSHGRHIMSAKDNSGNTALHIAASLGASVATELLLSRGCDNDVINSDQHTSLHLAIKNGHLTVVKLLYRWNANQNKDSEGNAPIVLAARRGFPEIVEFLASATGQKDKDRALFVATTCDDAAVVNVLLDQGAGVLAEAENGDRPIHEAVWHGNTQALKALLQVRTKEQLKAKDKDGNTALTLAMKYAKKDIVESLLRCEGYFPNTKERKELIKHFPDSLTHVMNKYITVEGMTITYDFKFFQTEGSEESSESNDNISNESSKDDDSILSLMAKDTKAWRLLKHPLAVEYRSLKFGYMQPIFMAFFIYHLLFTIGFTMFCIVSARNVTTNATNETDCGALWERAVGIHGRNFEIIALFLRIFTGTLASIGVLIEVIQMILQRTNWSKYLKPHNLIDWAVCVISLLVTSITNGCLAQAVWQNWLSIFGVAFAWYNLSDYLSRVSSFGYYIILVKEMTLTLSMCLVGCLPILFGAASIFCILFPDTDAFGNPIESSVKTLAMMVGELDFDGHFLGENQLRFGYLSYMCFVIFVIIVTTVIMNLLTSLAVKKMGVIDDTEEKIHILFKVQIPIYTELETACKDLPWLRNKGVRGQHSKHSKEIDKEVFNKLTFALPGITDKMITGKTLQPADCAEFADALGRAIRTTQSNDQDMETSRVDAVQDIDAAQEQMKTLHEEIQQRLSALERKSETQIEKVEQQLTAIAMAQREEMEQRLTAMEDNIVNKLATLLAPK